MNLLQRLAQTFLRLAGVSVLAFAFLELAPGDYLDEMKVNPQIAPEAVARWREDYGLQRSAVSRYGRWAAAVLQGDFGQSMAYGLPVSRLLWDRAGRTLLLSLTALALSWLIAVPLGVWCAYRPRGVLDRALGVLVAALLSLPDLLVGLLILALALRWGLPPVSGQLLPAALALAAVSFAPVFRHTRSAMREVLALPFVDHLRACGVADRRILFGPALRAAANPLITLFGLTLAGLTSASLIVEVTLSWPGLGPLLLEAILARDVAVVLAAVLLSSALLLVGNLVSDLLLLAADPRIRSGREAQP